MHRILVLVLAGLVSVVLTEGAAFACGSLVAANGAVDLEHTTTLAAYHDGVEHYVTSFQFGGDPTSFGSIVPLPGRPTKVERGGSWTLQRLEREVRPVVEDSARTASAAPEAAQVLQQVRIDSLDVTILRGGGAAVARWARRNGFALSPDAPRVLEFYARRSPYFMAARFDTHAAAAQGLRGGDGIPVHLTIPVDEPWVPLRILATAKPAAERVAADVFLLTDRQPALLHGAGFTVERSERASAALLDDLRADKGMGWVPSRMWLTSGKVDALAGKLRHDLAIDTHGNAPGPVAAGFPASLTWLLGSG